MLECSIWMALWTTVIITILAMFFVIITKNIARIVNAVQVTLLSLSLKSLSEVSQKSLKSLSKVSTSVY